MAGQRDAELWRNRSGESGPTSPASSRSESSSSKSPSTGESIDFRFLNFTHYQDAKDAQTRKNVRSHVTGVQHRRQREAAAEQAKRTHQSSSRTIASPISQPASFAGSPGVSETDASSSEEAASPVSIPPPTSRSLVRLNPLEIYPVEWHPYLRPVMDHYLNNMAIDLPQTDAASRELIRTTFMSIVLSDHASMHAVMLAAGAHWNKVRPRQAHRIDLLQLRGMAIQEINQALTDRRSGGRATSEQLVAAVGKMATYELLFGQREIFHTHMTGLQRMVSLRGGLQALGLGGLSERILLWIDSNAMSITGASSLYFPPSVFSSTSGHPRPNQRLFLLGVQHHA